MPQAIKVVLEMASSLYGWEGQPLPLVAIKLAIKLSTLNTHKQNIQPTELVRLCSQVDWQIRR